MGRTVVPDGDVLIGDGGAEGRDQVPALGDEARQALDRLLARGVQSGGEDHRVAAEILLFRGDEVDLDVQVEQRVVHPAQHVVVGERGAEDPVDEPGLQGEPLQRGQRPVAHHDRHPIALAQPGEALRVRGPLAPDDPRFEVRRIRGEVVAEQPLPVGLEGVVDRVPVPVHDAERTAGDVAVGLQAQLAGVGEPAHLPLRLGLEHEVVRPALERAGHVAAEGDLLAGQAGLRGVVDVGAGEVHGARGGEVVHRRLQPVGPARRPVEVEVLGDELVLARVLAHDVVLPAEEIVHERAAERLPGGAERAVDGAAHVREVLPGVDAVGPVRQAEGVVERVEIVVEAFPQVLDEGALRPARCRVVVLGLVVDLEADHVLVACGALEQGPDHALGVKQVGRAGDVHDLPGAVASRPAAGLREHLGVGGDQPGGHGVGGGAHDHRQPRLARRLEGAVHVGEVEDPGLRFERGPRGLRDADDVVPRLRHHRRVLGGAVVGEIFGVVGGAVQQTVHRCTLRRASRSVPRSLALSSSQ